MAHCRFVEVKCFISQLEKKINMRFDRVSLNGTVFTKVKLKKSSMLKWLLQGSPLTRFGIPLELVESLLL